MKRISRIGSRNNQLTALVWLTLMCAVYREVSLRTTLFYIGGFNLNVTDLIFAAGASVLLVHCRRSPQFNAAKILVLILSFIFLVNIIRGAYIDLFDAISTMRLYGGFLFLLLLGVYMQADEWWNPQIFRPIIFTGGILSALVFARLVFGPAFPFGGSSNLVVDEINDGGRALSAQGTVLVVMAAVVLLARYQSPSAGRQRSDFALSVIFCISVLATRQGMATIICAIAWSVVYVAMPHPSRRRRAIFGLAATFCALLSYYILPEVVSLERLNDLLPQSFAFDLSKREMTLNFRQAIWSGLIEDRENWTTVSRFIGLPAGTKPTIWIEFWGGTLWELSVHSMYYGLLPTAGAIGLLIYICILAYIAILRFIDILAGRGMSGAILAFTFVIMAALMGISNDLRHENGLLIAAGLAGYAEKRRRYPVRSIDTRTGKNVGSLSETPQPSANAAGNSNF